MQNNVKEKLTAAIESKIAVNVHSKGFAPFATARKLAEAIVVEVAALADNLQIEAARKAAQIALQPGFADGTAPHVLLENDEVLEVVQTYLKPLLDEIPLQVIFQITAGLNEKITLKSVARQMNEQLGPTGKFPDGKLDDTDEGEVKMRISHNDQLVRIDFGKATAWFAMPKSQALTFAFTILDHCGVKIEMQPVPGTPQAPA